jgi:hypothetical protein
MAEKDLQVARAGPPYSYRSASIGSRREAFSAGDEAHHHQDSRAHRDQLAGQNQVDVGASLGIVEELGQEGPRADEPDETVGDGDPDDAARKRGGEPFEQELQQDVTPAGAERHAHADFAGSLLDVHEHDVHDADAADGEGHDADEREHEFESVDNGARDFVRL